MAIQQSFIKFFPDVRATTTAFGVVKVGTGLTINGTTGALETSGGISDGDKGDITVSSSGTVWTVDNDAITYAKMQNVSATDKLLGRSTSGSGDVEEITCTAAGRALIDDANAAAQRVTLGAGNLNYLGTWSGATTYAANDFVKYLGTFWIALQAGLNQEPYPGSAYWAGSVDVPSMSLASSWTSNDFGVILSDTDGLVKKIGLDTLLGEFIGDYVFASTSPTWTLVGGSGNTVPQYSIQDYFYSRHAEWMFIKCYARNDGGNEGAGTGQLTFTLPSAFINTGQIVGGIFPVGTAVNGTNQYILFGEIASGATVLSLYYQTVVSTGSSLSLGYTPLTGADQNNATRGISLEFSFLCGQN